jgi:small subunit ribosomal protein S20
LSYEEESQLANTKSALKALRQSERRTEHNRAIRVSSRTYVKKARLSLDASDSKEEAYQAVLQAIQALDRAAEKGIIHRNNAARHKSRLMTQYHSKFSA